MQGPSKATQTKMNLLNLQQSPAAFREALLIDADGGPRPLSECIEDWQRKDFEALDDGWRRAALGSQVEAKYQRGWIERGRGSSKSSDLAVMASYALFAARRPLSGIAAAGDQDQARLLRDAVGRLCYLNAWLGSIIEVQNYRVINIHTGSTLEIISSDAPTSYGLTPDCIIADEIVHWKKRDLWDSLLSSAAKRANCMLVVITNAGLQDDWQWTTREIVRTDPSWYFSRLEFGQASWITSDRLAEQERLLPGIAFRRLWKNEWTTGGGDALSPEVIAAAFHDELRPMSEAMPGYTFVAGVDAGITRDASAICILGVRTSHAGHARLRLAYTKVWRPEKDKKVNLGDVELALIQAHAHFNLKQISFDPWELRFLASRLQSGGMGRLDQRAMLPLVEVSPSGANLQRMASALLEAFNDRRIELYREPDLHRDLTRLRVEERSYGFRLVSPRDMFGHGDVCSALQLAILAATAIAAEPRISPFEGCGFDDPYSSTLEERERELQEEETWANQPEPSPFEEFMREAFPQRFRDSDRRGSRFTFFSSEGEM